MNTQQKHLWMAVVKITYSIPENKEKGVTAGQGIIETNVIIDTPVKKMTARSLSQIQEISLMKMQEQNNLDPTWLADFLIMNISYLGMMSLKEYLGKD